MQKVLFLPDNFQKLEDYCLKSLRFCVLFEL